MGSFESPEREAPTPPGNFSVSRVLGLLYVLVYLHIYTNLLSLPWVKMFLSIFVEKRVSAYASPKGVYIAFGWRLEHGLGMFWEQKLGMAVGRDCRTRVGLAGVRQQQSGALLCSKSIGADPAAPVATPVESQTSSPVRSPATEADRGKLQGWVWSWLFFFSLLTFTLFIHQFHIGCCSCLTSILSSRWMALLCYSWMLLDFGAFPSFLGFFAWKADTCMAAWV